jgi:hypothetical protein
MIPEIVLILSLIVCFFATLFGLESCFDRYTDDNKTYKAWLIGLLGAIYMIGVPVWLYQSSCHREVRVSETVSIVSVENNDGSTTQIASFSGDSPKVVDVSALEKKHFPDGTKITRNILENSSLGIYWTGTDEYEYDIVSADE